MENYCSELQNLINSFSDKNNILILLKDFNEFPCEYINDNEFINLKGINFDFIKDKFKLNYSSADILIIFENFILLMELKNPFNDRLTNLDDKERRNKIRRIIRRKYLPVIEGSINISENLFKDKNISEKLWISFLIDFTDEFINRLDYLAKLKKLASPKKQYDLLEIVKQEIFKILEEEIENIKDNFNLYDLTLWKCSDFYRPFFVKFKNSILCPK